MWPEHSWEVKASLGYVVRPPSQPQTEHKTDNNMQILRLPRKGKGLVAFLEEKNEDKAGWSSSLWRRVIREGIQSLMGLKNERYSLTPGAEGLEFQVLDS